jgi:hypothetical protein
MKKRIVWLWFLAGLLAALLLAGGIGFGMVDRATALADPVAPSAVSIFDSSPLMIPAAAFSSDGYDPASMFFSFWSGYLHGGNINTCFKAPAYLPKHAYMADMWTSVYDNDASAKIWIDLYRVDNYTGAVVVLADVSTTAASAVTTIQTPWDWVDSTSMRNFVSYPQYSYYVGACAESSTTRLYSVRIYFNENKMFLPLLKKK